MSTSRMIAGTALVLQFISLFDQWQQANGSPWATPAQEALDEKHDAQIFRAIVQSMAEWSRRSKRHSHRQPRAANGVCYDDVGCFSDSGGFGYLDMLPSPPTEVGTRFLVFGGSGAGRSQAPQLEVAFANRSALWGSSVAPDVHAFNASAVTKVIVHGFGSSCSHVWVYEMRSALMAVENCNVICVDWEGGASVPNYVRAAANTRLVGKQVAVLLAELHEYLGIAYEHVHLIGFSLGAHVAGFAGAELKNLSRITGLDPAGPLFESQDPRARLDSSDARFVDVIHSNGENLILGGLGSWQPMGHVDFYPNGGRMQKGCSNIFVGAVSDILWSASDVEGRSLCNHRRAYKFFTDSVSPRCHFPAFPCDSYEQFLDGTCFPCSNDRRCGNMGYYSDRSAGRGSLFLITRDEEPFCAHQYHVRLESATSDPPVSSYGSLRVTLVGSADINETFPLTQKEDEQMRSGESLSRLLVPHPVMQEPLGVQLLYTAYSGWWTSGLPVWPVRKLSLVDSFGKSMSVCKRQLLLESGKPVTLPLFPGECNPPRNRSNVAMKSSQSDELAPLAPETVLGIFSGNGTQYIPTPVIQVGDEDLTSAGKDPNDSPSGNGGVVGGGAKSGTGVGRVHPDNPLTLLLDGVIPPRYPWQTHDFQDGGGNSLEDSRSFQSSAPPIPSSSPSSSPASSLFSTQTAAHNWTDHEIKEPVVTSTADPLGLDNFTSPLPEIREPILSPKATTAPENTTNRNKNPGNFGSYDTEENRRLWIPSSDLNPPPLGMTHAWQNWNLAKTSAAYQRNYTKLILEGPIPLGSPPQEEKPSKRSHQVPLSSSSVVIQFLPQRLAAFLEQAEHYARLTFSPLLSDERDTKGSADEISPTQRRPKHFTTTRPIRDKTIHPRADVDVRGNMQDLVPFSHSYRNEKRNEKQYIPVRFPTENESLDLGKGEIITVTPEDIKKSFRSVKIERNSSEKIVPTNEDKGHYEEFRPIYRGKKTM